MPSKPVPRLLKMLDDQLGKDSESASKRLAIPYGTFRPGWIHAVRCALGVSEMALGKRLGISHQAVRKLEVSELSGKVTIGKLAKVAEAMNCRFVYGFVPNNSDGFVGVVNERTSLWGSCDASVRPQDPWRAMGDEDFTPLRVGRWHDRLDSAYDAPVKNASGLRRAGLAEMPE